MSYAARHPGMFSAAASFSGMVDSLLRDRVPTGPQLLYKTMAGACPGLNMDNLWGDPPGHRAIWRAHNPTDQAAGLAGTKLFIAAGDGVPGPLDPPSTTPDPVIEPSAHAQSQDLLNALNRYHVPATVDFYTGTHSFPYWIRELDRAFPMLVSAVGA
jgi:S-formylglutathione hydrolase FrmB